MMTGSARAIVETDRQRRMNRTRGAIRTQCSVPTLQYSSTLRGRVRGRGRVQPARRSLWSVLMPADKVGLASEARSTGRSQAKSGERSASDAGIQTLIVRRDLKFGSDRVLL